MDLHGIPLTCLLQRSGGAVYFSLPPLVFQSMVRALTDLRAVAQGFYELAQDYNNLLNPFTTKVDSWTVCGAVRGICRLTGARAQRGVCNGHKRKRAFKFQTIATPDGMLFHLFGPVEGCLYGCGSQGYKNAFEWMPDFASISYIAIKLMDGRTSSCRHIEQRV
ncbi:hypothetical protein PHMEG_00027788 [Phytophthora megakarya]|uniref:Uncharacterized protein n=1 Tax=Phytophthora megakarya TaxID=4795 RepID=A0A225V641_9STRA|nr:hypothetical protein PHMEG_00027788 [Phytophthora megakarya]